MPQGHERCPRGIAHAVYPRRRRSVNGRAAARANAPGVTVKFSSSSVSARHSNSAANLRFKVISSLKNDVYADFVVEVV